MKTLGTLSASLVLALLLGCGGGSGLGGAMFPTLGPLRASLKIEFIGGSFCCDPDAPFPQEIGTLRITHLGSPTAGRIAVDIGDFTDGSVITEPGVSTSVTLEKDDVLDTKLFATSCDWDSVEGLLTMQDGIGGSTLSSERQWLSLNNGCGPLRNLFALTELLIPAEDPVAFFGDSVNIAIIGILVAWSSPAVSPSIPSWLWSEINRFGIMRRNLLIALILKAFGVGATFKPGSGGTAIAAPDFPCGAGPNGYTVCPSMPASMDEGDYFFAYLSTEADIPLSSDRFITYGFVFDGDGNPNNNYVPHPSFPDDYFKDTDRWYTLDYDPVTGWTLVCRDATNSVITEVPTAARAIIRGNSVMLVVPSSEFAAAEPSYRVTAFTHTGDYGAPPPTTGPGTSTPPCSRTWRPSYASSCPKGRRG